MKEEILSIRVFKSDNGNFSDDITFNGGKISSLLYGTALSVASIVNALSNDQDVKFTKGEILEIIIDHAEDILGNFETSMAY